MLEASAEPIIVIVRSYPIHMMNSYVRAVLVVALPLVPGAAVVNAAALCDHEVVLDSTGRLQPWTSYDNVLRYSQNFITNCPTTATAFGNDPWYLVTSKLNADGTYMANQNCQGSHAYWATQTLSKYYAYSGDAATIQPVRNILDRIMQYQTPVNAAWANCPITQDNTPDGQYTDTYSEPDKMAMVGSAYVGFYRLTGEQKYLNAAVGIADTLAQKVQQGDATHLPLPFRVEASSGAVTGVYTSDMVAPVRLFGDLISVGQTGNRAYQTASNTVWDWVMTYPMENNAWSGYYEDVGDSATHLNQQVPIRREIFCIVTFDSAGQEILRLTFVPRMVLADGRPLDSSQWTFGDYRGVSNVLIINRTGAMSIEISSVPEPTSLMLFAMSAVSLVAWRLRRR